MPNAYADKVWCSGQSCSVWSGDTIRKHTQELDEMVAKMASDKPDTYGFLLQQQKDWHNFIYQDCYLDYVARGKHIYKNPPTHEDDAYEMGYSKCIADYHLARKEKLQKLLQYLERTQKQDNWMFQAAWKPNFQIILIFKSTRKTKQWLGKP